VNTQDHPPFEVQSSHSLDTGRSVNTTLNTVGACVQEKQQVVGNHGNQAALPTHCNCNTVLQESLRLEQVVHTVNWVKPCHITTECHSGLDPESLCAHNVFCEYTQKQFTDVAVFPWSDCVLQRGRRRGERGRWDGSLYPGHLTTVTREVA